MNEMRPIKQLMIYLKELHLTENDVISVVDDTHASAKLKSATGRQIIAAYPQMTQPCNSCDGYTSELSAAIFVLEKSMAASRTAEQEFTQYIDMLDTVEKFASQLRRDASGEGGCPILSGVQIKTLEVTPIYNMFGGWGGWMIEITM